MTQAEVARRRAAPEDRPLLADIVTASERGAALTQQRALLRYLLSWLWFLPPLGVSWLLGLPARESAVLAVGWVAIWAILARFHPDRQFWHDAWAGTRLITWVPAAQPKGPLPSKPMAPD